MKLPKMSSLKPSAIHVKTRFDQAPVESFSDDDSSEQSQIEFSGTSPNYLKPTSFSDAKKVSSQEGNESDSGSVGSSSSSLTEDNGIRGGTELRKTLKKSRSIRLGIFGSLRPTSRRAKSRFDQRHSSLSSNAATPPTRKADASPHYWKATSCSEGKKMHFQASLRDSESNFGSIDDNRRNSHKSNLGSSSFKSMQTLRTPSMRISRISINKSSFKSKRSSVNKCSEESSVYRATCSSTFKDSKFPSHVEHDQGDTKSEKNSVIKVCRYNYCSLHGHQHSPTPPLKRLLSKRRRSLKTQKSLRLRRQSSVRSKYPDDILKEIETSPMVTKGEPELEEQGSNLSVQIFTKPRIELVREQSEGNEDTNLNQEKSGDLVTEVETIGQFVPVGDSKPNSTAHEVFKSQIHKKKHISMWHLIHQHMVSDLDVGADEKKQVDDTNRLLESQSSDCSPGFSDSYQNMGTENHDTDNQEIELRKIYAIKMVREAIEKVLLPEVQDQSSDDQSICSDITSEQDLLEKNDSEGGKLSIPNSTAEKISDPEQEVTASKEGTKTEKRTLKSWSNLKKWILLKRFVKELEKVKKFNPWTPKHPSLEPDPEAEKVSLRHQMIDKKKSSEEWMLDYALQQVVSELAPTQKRKVELLIKAFETVVPPSDEQHIQMIFPKLKGIRNEGCCTESELDDQYVSQATYNLKKVEDIVTSNPDKEDKNSIIDDTQSNVPVDGKAEQKAHDGIKYFNLSHLKFDSASSGQTMEVDALYDVPDQPLHITKSQNADGNGESTVTDLAEAAADNSVISSTSVCGPLEEFSAARELKNEDSELDTEPVEGFSPVGDSELDNDGYKGYKTEVNKEKNVSMWHLIHQQMVAGLAVEGKTKQLDKENEERASDVKALAATESSGLEYHNTDSQEVELRKIFAIKMVRQAIEKILLPEVQDQSSDDQSITSEIMSDQDLIENNHGEVGEPSISTSMESRSNKVTDDISLSQEGTRLATAKISESENEKTTSKAEDQSDKKTPKGWSNLKKLILLKRFIKELEKVRKFNPKKPRHLPLKPGPEAEEVSLRHQMMDERKDAEEWMLDYALRKVVSELAPKQKRKVALLVKAFETVAPSSEEPQIQMTFPKLKGINREGCCSESEQDNFASKVTEAEVKVMDIVTSNCDNGDNNSSVTDKKSDVAVDKEDQKEVHKDAVPSFHLELLKDGSVSRAKTVELDGLNGVNVEPSYVTRSAALDRSREATAIYSIASSASDCGPLEQLIAAKKENSGSSETECTGEVANKTQLDKQKHISMWQLLCQHVVSGIATKAETQLLDGEDEETTTSCVEYSTADHDSSSQKFGFSQTDAVKLVREAIEEILLPDIQDDSSDVQSIASDVGEPSILDSIDSPKDSFREQDGSEVNQEEKGSAAHNLCTPGDQISVSTVGNKSDQKKPKNWNKLKKLILLKRSIKALEKARKSNPQAPRHLPLETDPQEEKVDLKHQLKDEKEKAQEWMKDYALQHIVTQLTPARKRRVLMLVEAFEAVVPMPEI
ncbi:calmodulin binding protein PICBP-like isoform X1 [Camellia sinensis]|uniref:calmodulin binding protein PICBP-like isoform X1 n=1 Tax=Camellia sinensis TaxID=4442 RepID=UPI0010365191|nr:calmodulin binding protein PICBP-like isoform X1 [Camellia sinensis]XP_028081922.1 calmodulin binding protein PICBP-like isoform X1 [Camellia sinensis]